jgi:glycosyltransferase involved in cell wall biosynthesis
MKIAMIASGFLPVTDGVTIAVSRRLAYLDRLGHRTLLFCPDYSPIASVYPDWQDYTGQISPNTRVVNLPSEPFLDLEFERSISQKSYKIFLQELEKFQPDLIHVDEPERLWLGFFQRAGLDYARRNNIPCISFFHTNFIEYIEDFFPMPRPLLKVVQWLMTHHRNWIYNAYDATLVSSPSTARKVTRTGFRKVIRDRFLGIDVDRYRGDLRQESFFEKNYGISGIDNKLKLVFLGRLTPEKGWNFTLESLHRYSERVDWRNIAFIIAGEGSLKNEIVGKLNALTEDVYCLGRVTPDAVPALLMNGDIYVTTSEKETKGLTVLEARAAGIPVIAPRTNGIIDSIQDGIDGFLFEPGDPESFIEKLSLLCGNRELRQRFGEKGKENIQKYNWQGANENLLRVWKKAIAGDLNGFHPR